MDISSLTPNKQVKLQYWLDVIRQCRASGLTNQAWCEQHNISLKSYYYWIAKIRKLALEDLPRKSYGVHPPADQTALLPDPASEFAEISLSQLKFLYPLKTLVFPAFSPPRFGPFPSFFPLREEMRETFFRPSLQPYPVALRKFAWPLWWRGRKCSSWYLHQNVPAAPAHP